MSDVTNPEKTTSEYELQGDDVGSMEQAPGLGGGASAAPAFQMKPWMRRFIVPVGIIVAILIVYMFLSWSSSKKTKGEEQAAAEMMPKKEVTAVPAPVVTQPMITAAPAAPSQEQIAKIVSDQVQQSQDAVQRKLDDLAQQLGSTRQDVATLTNNINQNKQDIATINQNLTGVTSALAEVNKNIQKLTASKKKPIKKVKRKKMVPPKPYHVKAVVPGRVWLESADGKEVSLRVGDSLPGYGTVELISPRQGMVITSTGAVIQYGVNDI